MRPDETRPMAYLFEFVFRSKWNVVGLMLGIVVASAIWHFVEPIREKIVLAVISFVLIFFGCMAIGIKREYQEEDRDQ